MRHLVERGGKTIPLSIADCKAAVGLYVGNLLKAFLTTLCSS